MDDQRTDRTSGDRLTVFCLGARRGAKFGIKESVILWAIYNSVVLFTALFHPGIHETTTLYVAKYGWLVLIAVTALELVGAALILAIPCALLGGAVALMRNRRAKPTNSDNN